MGGVRNSVYRVLNYRSFWPSFIVIKTNSILAQWIVIKLGIGRLYCNVTTDFNFIAERGLYITCGLNHSPDTRQLRSF